ncbi:MAG: hypothetical protein GX979_06485 [Firmicutes bacterium]|nr:hypothetical protein [Bacillota bacterium]
MSKFINQPIELKYVGDFPLSFSFGQNFIIQYIVKHWREAGQWWLGESELFIYEVSTNLCHCELHFLPNKNTWILYRFTD